MKTYMYMLFSKSGCDIHMYMYMHTMYIRMYIYMYMYIVCKDGVNKFEQLTLVDVFINSQYIRTCTCIMVYMYMYIICMF